MFFQDFFPSFVLFLFFLFYGSPWSLFHSQWLYSESLNCDLSFLPAPRTKLGNILPHFPFTHNLKRRYSSCAKLRCSEVVPHLCKPSFDSTEMQLVKRDQTVIHAVKNETSASFLSKSSWFLSTQLAERYGSAEGLAQKWNISATKMVCRRNCAFFLIFLLSYDAEHTIFKLFRWVITYFASRQSQLHFHLRGLVEELGNAKIRHVCTCCVYHCA